MIAVNGVSVIDGSRAEVEALMAAPGFDEVIVTVLSSGTMRLLLSRIDMRLVLAHFKPIEVMHSITSVLRFF